MQGRINLPGLRWQGADSSIVAAAQLDEVIVVTVIVRPNQLIPTQIEPFAQLTREAFLGLYGARQADLDAVAQFARQHKLNPTIDGVRRLVELRGASGDFEKAFAITMAMYQVAAGVQRGYEGCPSVPPELADVIVAVIGLHTGGTQTAPPTGTDTANLHGPKIVRRQLDTPAALEAFYRFPSGDGEGQCIAIIEMDGGYRIEDVKPYFRSLGVSPQIEDVLVHSADGVGQNLQVAKDEESALGQFIDWMEGKGYCDENVRQYFEVTMDVSMLGALAPKAQIEVYFGCGNLRALMYMIDEALFVREPRPSVISISWGFEERQILDDQSDIAAAHQIDELFLCAAHMGVTICCSAGDWGASDQVTDAFRGTGYDVQFPAASPYVLACGGTAIVDDGTEVVWNADFPTPSPPQVPQDWCKHGATGGGYSKLFARPPWQRQLGDSGTGVQPDQRALPDVAAVADPQCGIRCMMVGRTFPTGGTSAAAPMWAALVARLNQQLGRRVGCLNPILYAHAAASGILNDVTVGDNRFSDGDVGFDAGPGWDACTGLGTPNGEALLALLKTLVPPS
jgi:kumamolisin